MSKTYLMPGEELTPEQRDSVKNFTEEQEQKTKEMGEKIIDLQKSKNKVTLEQLLKTRIDVLEDRVVVWPDPVEELTEGGIIKPKEAIDKERPFTGKVIAVGPGKSLVEEVTQAILLNILQFGTDISQEDFDKFKSQVFTVRMPLVPGDHILYGRFAGTPSNDPDTDEPVLIMRPTDIFAKIKPA